MSFYRRVKIIYDTGTFRNISCLKTLLNSLTLSLIRQFCSRRLWTYFVKTWKISCGKRRNCTFCAISSFVTMFSNSHLLQRRQKASIWGKGLIYSSQELIQGPVERNPVWKHCGKRRNCSKWAISKWTISPLATMFFNCIKNVSFHK